MKLTNYEAWGHKFMEIFPDVFGFFQFLDTPEMPLDIFSQKIHLPDIRKSEQTFREPL